MSVEKKVVVNTDGGLDTRKIAVLVQTAGSFHTEDIKIEFNGRCINAKSLMGAINLAAPEGSEFIIKADGPNAEQAVSTLEELLNGGN